VQTVSRIAIGVIATTGVFVLLIIFVGIGQFVEAVSMMDPWLAGAIVSIVAIRRLVQGTILYVAFTRFQVEVSYAQSFFISASTTFAKNATPFAQLGGEPLAAGIITDAVDDTYEESLAALSMMETVKFIPALAVFVSGSLYFAIYPTPIPQSITPIFGVFGVVLLVLPLVAAVIWRYRDRAQAIATAAVMTLSRPVSVIPRVSMPDEESIRERIASFFSIFVDLTTDRRLVVEVAILSFIALFLTVLELWLALKAVGVDVLVPIVLFAVPFSRLASVLPSPGGVGGVEGVLVIFITALTSHPVRDVTTGVIISSGVGYWMTALVGGLGIAFALPLLSEERAEYEGS